MKKLFSLVLCVLTVLGMFGVFVYGAAYKVGDVIPNFDFVVEEPIKVPSFQEVYDSVTVEANAINGIELYKNNDFIITNDNNYISGLVDGYTVVSKDTVISVSVDDSIRQKYGGSGVNADAHISVKFVPFRKNKSGEYTAKVDVNGDFTEYYYSLGSERKVSHPTKGEVYDLIWKNDGANVIRDRNILYKATPGNVRNYVIPSYAYVETSGGNGTWRSFSENIIWGMLVEYEYGVFRQVQPEVIGEEMRGIFTNVDPNEYKYNNKCLFLRFFKIDEDYVEECLSPTGFDDVKITDYFANSVRWGVKNKIVNGTSDTEFSPNDTCTHAHILTFLWRTQGSHDMSENMYEGLNGDEWYAHAVSWALEEGLLHEIPDADFILSPCTRMDTIRYLYAVSGDSLPKMSSYVGTEIENLNDISKSEKPYVLWAYRKGITTGVSDTEFAPNLSCTRGQIITFLYRAYANN